MASTGLHGATTRFSPMLLPRRSILVLVAAVAAGVGIGIALTALPHGRPSLAMGLMAIPLLLPVAVAKTATACGMNALGTLANLGRPVVWRLGSAAVYVGASALTASLVGLALSSLGSVLGISDFAWALVPGSLYLGLWELGVIHRRPPFASRWQVPRRWVRNTPLSPAVWGVFLGSGLATQMPYPSFYALLALVAILPVELAVLLMAAYGVARALPGVGASLTSRLAGTSDLALMVRFRLMGHLSSGVGCLVFSGGLVPALMLR